MTAQLEPAGEGAWRLAGRLDFATVPALYRRTDELLGGESVELDLSAVETANSAGVALLLEWRRQAWLRGMMLRLRALPESVRRVARLSDVEPLLTGDAPGSVESVTRSTADRSATL